MKVSMQAATKVVALVATMVVTMESLKVVLSVGKWGKKMVDWKAEQSDPN